MSDSTILLTPKIVNNDALLAESIEAFLAETSAAYTGAATLVVLQDALQGALSETDWALFLELESLGNERSARLQELIARWAFDQGVRYAESKARNGK